MAAIDTVSYWAKCAQGIEYPPPAKPTATSPSLGGGIVGVTTALAASRGRGAKVALLEARRIGSGATGYTTAKLELAPRLTYATSPPSIRGRRRPRLRGGQRGGHRAVSSLVDELGIECDLPPQAELHLHRGPDHASQLMEEAETARAGRAAGDRSSPSVAELPFAIAAAVRFDGQAEFHPLHYLHGLAEAAADAGCAVHERSRVVSVDAGRSVRASRPRTGRR